MEKTTLMTIRNLGSAQNTLQKAFERLSSGKQINRASDNPAGLAVADGLAVLTTLSKGASRNVDYGVSALQVADSALGQISDITTRLSELATQSANGTLSDTQRGALQQEFSALTAEAQRIGQTTQFNGRPLLDGSEISIQAGTDSSVDSQIKLTLVDVNTALTGVSSDISSQSAAQSSLDSIASFRETINSSRGQLGSVTSRLNSAKQNAETSAIGYATAESRIRDADIADEVGKLTAAKILQQGAAALSAQANLSRENVLRLLG